MIGVTDVEVRFDAQSRVKLAIASGSLFLRLQRGDSLLFCTPPDAIDVSVKIGTPFVMARLKQVFLHRWQVFCSEASTKECNFILISVICDNVH